MGIFKGSKRGFSLPFDFVPAGDTLLNLQYNNSNADAEGHAVTPVGSVNFGTGLYAEVNGCRVFDGFEADVYDMSAETGNLDVYTVSGWIRNRVNTNASVGTINSLHLRDYLTRINQNGAIRFSQSASGEWIMVVLYGEINSSDLIPQKGRVYSVGDVENKYIHVSVSVDTLNNYLKVVVNNRNITNDFDTVNFPTFDPDLNSMESLPADRDVLAGGRGISSSFLTNCDVYNTKVRKYIISEEEIKAEYKKYPKI